MFNNIFWDNRAGAWNLASGTVSGIGLTGDPNPVNHWDMGVADGTGLLHPHYTSLQVLAPDNYPSGTGAADDGTNSVGNNPNVIQAYDTRIAPFPWRGDPHFINTITIAQDVPELLAGNYHLSTGSGSPPVNSAQNSCSAAVCGPGGPFNAPAFDIDNQTRPLRICPRTGELTSDERQLERPPGDPQRRAQARRRRRPGRRRTRVPEGRGGDSGRPAPITPVRRARSTSSPRTAGSLPAPANPTKYFPDTYATRRRNVYLFGFRDVTGILSAARTRRATPS